MRVTFLGKVVAIQYGLYTNYVFKNLDESNNSLLRYITTSKVPNWIGYFPSIDEVGYVECEYVKAGDHYFKPETGEVNEYRYTVCYFIRFIKKEEVIKEKEFNF